MSFFRGILLSILMLSAPAFAQTLITQSNVTSLSQAWSAPLGSAMTAPPVDIGPNGSSYPISYETLLVGLNNGSAYALNADTGTTIWSGATDSTPIVSVVTAPASGSFPATAIFLTTGDCVYSFDLGSSGTGTLKWHSCFSGTGVQLLLSATGSLLVAENPSSGGTVHSLDFTSGSSNWTYNTTDPLVGIGTSIYAEVVASATSTLYQISTGGGLVQYTSMSSTPVGAPIISYLGINFPSQSLCASPYDTREAYAFVSAGSSSYTWQLTGSGAGTLQSVTLGTGSNVVANGSLFFRYSFTTQRFRSGNLFYTCTTFYYGGEPFYPLASGEVAASELSGFGTLAATSSVNVAASAQPVLFALDNSNSFGTTGMVYSESGQNLTAILIPSGSYSTIFTATGNIFATTTGLSVTSSVQRIYFGDSSGYIYAISPGGL